MPQIILIAHNIRSTHNVGSLFRTAEGIGVTSIILSGYTPYPAMPLDVRLPHISHKLTQQIHKTALGAESFVSWTHAETPDFQALKNDGYQVVALEQDPAAIMLPSYKSPDKVALLLGEEVHGLTSELLALCNEIIEIPMYGKKESFNVSVAAGIALYHLSTR